MKKIFARFILAFLLFPSLLNASHLMGGEITWTCDGLGNYIFKVKMYRDCNGIPGPSSLSLFTNALSTTINCSLISQTDISPVGVGCPTCASPGGFFNAVEEFIYQSSPITLTGFPPASGWYFSYSDCCRNANITNLSSSGSGEFTLRAIMYKYVGATPGPCFDNSPQFAEAPSLALCNADTVNYANSALDPDLDSLVYSWGNPLSGTTWPFANYPFAAGYSATSPLPSSTQNPANTGASLDPATGITTFYSQTSGVFVTCTKISSYKCGQLVSEVFREVEVGLMACPINSGPVAVNHGPAFLPDNNTAYYTVLAGDSFNLNLNIVDYEFLNTTPPSIQSVELSSSGIAFGDGDTSSTSGCAIPPCATLNHTSPYAPGGPGVAEQLKWLTACSHAGFNNGCLQHHRTFHFVFRANDNFCPTNGVRYKNVIVYVSGPEIYQIGNDLAVSYPGVSLQWYLNGTPIPGATDTIYTPTQSGVYTVMATTGGGCQMISNPVNRTMAGMAETEAGSSFSIYPNPVNADRQLQVLVKNFSTGQQVINITDISGRLVKTFTIDLHNPTEHLVFDITGLNSGIYQFSISNSSGIQQNSFIIK